MQTDHRLEAPRSPRNRTKGFRPKSAIGKKHVERARKAFNLWYFYSPRMDADLVATSDGQYVHCLWLEMQPDVLSYGLDSSDVTGNARPIKPPFSGWVRYRDGRLAVHDISVRGRSSSVPQHLDGSARQSQADSIGATYVLETYESLRQRSILTDNARDALAFAAAARHHSLAQARLTLQALFARSECWTMGDLLGAVPVDQAPLLGAALVRCVMEGTLRSDLEAELWGKWSRFWLPGGQPFAAPSVRGLLQPRGNLTVTVEHDLPLMMHRRANTPPGKGFTRSTIPPHLRDTALWPQIDELSLEPSDLPRFRKLRAFVVAYLAVDGPPVRALELEHGVHRSTALRQINRALQLADDGSLHGWRAFASHAHVAGYARETEPVPKGKNGGCAGALTRLFVRFPEIERGVIAYMFKTPVPGVTHESLINGPGLHQEFLKLCSDAGLRTFDYPFNTKTQAREALRLYAKREYADNFEAAARVLGGPGCAKRAKLGNGVDRTLVPGTVYAACYQDGHGLDFIGTISMPHPKGRIRVPLSRWELQLVVEHHAKAVLGYGLVVSGAAKSLDALAAVDHALSVWKPMPSFSERFNYPEGAGFPSGLIPELAGAAWSTHYLDNASVYTSEAMLERMRQRVGCSINLGPVGDWSRRHIIEGVFSVLEKRGFQRLPNTTGGHPKDPRRRNAEAAAVSMECDYEEFCFLVDVALATYNSTPQPGLGHRSPLQLLREFAQDSRSHFVPRRLPAPLPCSPALGIVIERRVIRGNVAKGRRPYVEIDGADYRSDVLAHAAHLIGQEVFVHINERAMRTVEAFLPGDRSLGILRAGGGWAYTEHDRPTRKAINNHKAHEPHMYPLGSDYVQQFLRAITRTAADRAAQTAAPRVNRSASDLANIVHRNGLEVPETSPDDVPLITALSTTPPVRLTPWLVQPMKRKASY